KRICGYGNANFVTKVEILCFSVVSDFKNFNLAGTLKNRLRTVIVVPLGQPIFVFIIVFPSKFSIFPPMDSFSCLEIKLKCDTEDIEASASPRKPKVLMLKRSLADCNLLVA